MPTRRAGCWPSSSWANSTPAGSISPRRRPTPSPRSSRRSTTNRPTASPPADQDRILGNDPSTAYLNFGLIFLAAKRDELAVKALERGLIYDEDNPQIALLLAETLLKLNKGEQALALVERARSSRQPQGVEAYELLAKVLTALKRENEITPRLEEAARRDSKNVPLQYVLADRYRETGQPDKAEALYKALLTSQPTPQTYRALSISLLKRKKAADLLKVICEALKRPGTPRPRPSSRSSRPPPPTTPWPRPCSTPVCNSSRPSPRPCRRSTSWC